VDVGRHLVVGLARLGEELVTVDHVDQHHRSVVEAANLNQVRNELLRRVRVELRNEEERGHFNKAHEGKQRPKTQGFKVEGNRPTTSSWGSRSRLTIKWRRYTRTVVSGTSCMRTNWHEHVVE
jgi:hypothetical protein